MPNENDENPPRQGTALWTHLSAVSPLLSLAALAFAAGAFVTRTESTTSSVLQIEAALSAHDSRIEDVERGLLSVEASASRPDAIGPLPADSVVAFDRRDGCPDGWILLRDSPGRFLVGADADHPWRRLGGTSSVRLETMHLPPHSHDAGTLRATKNDDFMGVKSVESDGSRATRAGGLFKETGRFGKPDWGEHSHNKLDGYTGKEGQGVSFASEPPFLPVTWCTPESRSAR